ncbi:hypothetical protein [Helicobacter aurati]|uniref:hypothetical protein n=1 Tax=Helicobacter aurati TaxID=137778 RepID=UPI0011C083C3|nr:hypothetical protein [Helicobacter aurati]
MLSFKETLRIHATISLFITLTYLCGICCFESSLCHSEEARSATEESQNVESLKIQMRCFGRFTSST